jgi:hypothetical protein
MTILLTLSSSNFHFSFCDSYVGWPTFKKMTVRTTLCYGMVLFFQAYLDLDEPEVNHNIGKGSNTLDYFEFVNDDVCLKVEVHVIA